MEVSRESATIVRSWLGPCAFPSPPPSIVLRPDRLGLGATPVVVSEESRKRTVLGDKIRRKLKKQKVQDVVRSPLQDGGAHMQGSQDGEEGMSRSDAISGRAIRPLSMEMVCLGKRRRKKWSAVMLSSPMAGSSASHSPTAPRDVSHSPGSGISVTTPPEGCGGGACTPKASPLPAHAEVGSSNSTSVCDGTVVGSDGRNTCVKETDVVRTPTAVSAKTKFKESFNFSFSVSRSPYSRTKDRCRLVRIGSRARHRKSLGVR